MMMLVCLNQVIVGIYFESMSCDAGIVYYQTHMCLMWTHFSNVKKKHKCRESADMLMTMTLFKKLRNKSRQENMSNFERYVAHLGNQSEFGDLRLSQQH